MMTTLRVLAVLAVCAAALPLSPAAHAEQGTPATRKAVDDFYKALNAMFAGDAGPMEKLWSRRPDVTYMGPDGGFRHGWIEIDADFAAAAARKLGGSVEAKDISIAVGRDIAVVGDTEIGNRNGRTNALRATNVFRLENGQWKMIAHHVDPLAGAAH
jgi:ketosteroid isomerase-like protein